MNKEMKKELETKFELLDLDTQNSIVYISSECRLTKLEVTNLIVTIQEFMIENYNFEMCHLGDWEVLENQDIRMFFDMNNGKCPDWGFKYSNETKDVDFGHCVPNFVFES